MAKRWRKGRLRVFRLYWVGIAVILAGTALTCLGGYRIARSPEFLAAYRIRAVDAVYYDKHIGPQDETYYRQEIARLRSGCKLAVIGFAMLMGGVVVARFSQNTPVKVHRPKPLPSLFKGASADCGPKRQDKDS